MKKVNVLLSTCVVFFTLSCQFKGAKSSAPAGAAGAGGSVASEAKVSFVDQKNQLIFSVRPLTFVGPKSGEGYFSPDGSKMIFQSERQEGNPFYQMYLMDLKSGKTQRLSPGQGKTTCGWIHPSMRKVLFSSTHLDPDVKKKTQEEFETRAKAVKARYSWSFDDSYDIFSSDLQGKNLKRLTHEKGYDAEASYSPDGKWIAFASNRRAYTEKLEGEDLKYFQQDASYMMDIYIMKEDGTQVRQLTTSKGYDGGPFFSADGKKITWRRFAPNGATAEIYTMNVDGSEQTQVTRLKSMSWAPFFHPSGDYIIFASSVLGYANFELFIVDSLGRKDPVRVTFDEGFDGLPVFTPDGHGLSWTHRNEKGDSQIVMADWDDLGARRLLGLPIPSPQVRTLRPDINIHDVKQWVYYLSSPELQGRASGSAEEKIYAEKLAQSFKSWGLVPAGDKGTYLQNFEFTSGVRLGAQNSLEVVGSYQRKYKISEDYEPLSFSQTGSFKESPIVFVGYGIKAPAGDKESEYDSYKGLDVKGKWVLVLEDLPLDVSASRRQYLNLYARLQHKITVAKNEGALGVLFISASSPAGSAFGKIKFEGALAETTVPVLRVSSAVAADLIKFAGKDLSLLKRVLDRGEMSDAVSIPSSYLKAQVDLQFIKSKGINVIAKLPGSSKENIMIGAHGDHLGHGQVSSSLATKSEQGQIHPGADDNASGVAGVMELAHFYANKHAQGLGKNSRGLYFAIWAGEELGNLGSSYFVKNSKDISTYLNMDMIGRLRERLFVQGTGSAKAWPLFVEQVGLQTGLPMTAQEDPYLPTDSLAFYMGGVPTLSFFTGSHAEYHTPRDTADMVNYEGELRVLNTLRSLTDLLADPKTELPKYLKVASKQNPLEGRSFRVYLGTIPDYSQEGVKGVRITGTSKGSPAEVAGLADKDIIVEFDGMKIENLYDYVYTLQAVKPDKETSIKVLRDGVIKDFKIIPKLK